MDETPKSKSRKFVLIAVVLLLLVGGIGLVLTLMRSSDTVSPLSEGDSQVRVVFVTPEPSMEASPSADLTTPEPTSRATPRATSRATPRSSSSPASTPRASTSPGPTASP